MDDSTRAALDLLLGEYKELKAEQRDRMGLRDGMTSAALASQVAVIAAIVSGKAGPALLLALPPAAFVLGWVRLATADKVAEIRRYVRGPLRRDATTLLGSTQVTPFAWESNSTPRRASRRLGQLIADLVVFVAAPTVAVVVELSLPGRAPLMGVPGGLGVALLVFLGSEIVRRADLGAVAR